MIRDVGNPNADLDVTLGYFLQQRVVISLDAN